MYMCYAQQLGSRGHSSRHVTSKAVGSEGKRRKGASVMTYVMHACHIRTQSETKCRQLPLRQAQTHTSATCWPIEAQQHGACHARVQDRPCFTQTVVVILKGLATGPVHCHDRHNTITRFVAHCPLTSGKAHYGQSQKPESHGEQDGWRQVTGYLVARLSQYALQGP